MKSIITCCLNCEDRHVGCHDKCTRYQKLKQKNDIIRKGEKDTMPFGIYKGDFDMTCYRKDRYR